MIIVDTNITAKLLLAGDFIAQVQKLRIGHPEWIAPSLWMDEFQP